MIKIINFLNKLRPIFFVFAIGVFSFTVSIYYNYLDFDIWFRLIQGRHIIETHSVMQHDIFSYLPTHIWYDPEWLSSAIFFLVQKYFGLAGLTILKSVLLFNCIILLILPIKEISCKKYNVYNVIFFCIVTYLYVVLGANAASLRCQSFTFLFIPLWIFLLERARHNSKIATISLPFLLIFWLNLHGGALAGVGILIIYVIGEFLNKRKQLGLTFAILACLFAFLINPWGMKFIKFIMIDSIFINRSWILEWKSPFVLANSIKYLNLYFVFCVIQAIVLFFSFKLQKQNFAKYDKVKLLLILVTFLLSCFYVKHIVLFVIISSIFCFDDYMFCLSLIRKKIRKILNISDEAVCYLKIFFNVLICVVFFISLFLCFFKYDTKVLITSMTKNIFPLKPVEFIKINNIKGKIFAPYYYNSFIAYKLYPNVLISIDGREEQVYNYNDFNYHMMFLNWLGDNPQNYLKGIKPDIFLYEKNWAYFNYLRYNLEYAKVYEDSKFIVYVLQKKLAKNYQTPSQKPLYYLENLFDTNISFKN